MSVLSRLFGPAKDDMAAVRPLWHAVVATARARAWYVEGALEDSVTGRFDAITLVLAAVLLRMEREPALVEPSVRLTELFVTDMDGQLRQGGVGDLMVGKHMGRLMSVLGGRLGALRDAGGLADIEALVARNISLREGASPAAAATLMARFAAALDAVPAAALLEGALPAVEAAA